MRVAVLGGTAFIGRAIVTELVDAGHEVVVIHRGVTEPEDFPVVEHLHIPRGELVERRAELDAWRPEALVDTSCGTGDGARAALAAVDDLRLLVLSSMDVYRAYGGLHAHAVTDALPLTEESPLRPERYPYRGKHPGGDDYEKQDVEEAYLARGATVCRLPIVYGPFDYQRREEAVLRRVRAGRTRIPVGSGTLLISRGFVEDLATGVRLALEHPDAAGEVFNLCEPACWSIAAWWQQILDAAGSDAELVTVPDAQLPADLQLSGTNPQHLLVTPDKAQRLLGWRHRPVLDAVAASVSWHLDHPPTDASDDFTADDEALTHAASPDRVDAVAR